MRAKGKKNAFLRVGRKVLKLMKCSGGDLNHGDGLAAGELL